MCLDPARQMLAPLSGKMGNVLKLNETLGGLLVSVSIKFARSFSEQLIVEFM